MKPVYEYDAEVFHIVDGDTIDLIVDLGFRTYKRDRFRLAGIDTPERGDPRWNEARDFVAARLPPGARVIARTEHPKRRDPQDKYGRWLAFIHYLAPDGTSACLNDELLRAGLASEYGLK